jgi:NADPH-dependent curcumin reductase CurA
VNRKVVLSRRPDGLPKADDFAIVDEDVGELNEGEILVEVEHLGIDAFITTTLAHDGHHGQSELQEPVMALGTGRILESRSTDFEKGDAVFGGMGAQRYARKPSTGFRKLEDSKVAPKAYLGLLGTWACSG